jgi:hypothetical protein
MLSNYKVIRLKKFVSRFIDNCIISFYFDLYLVLYACTVKFDMMKNFEKFLVFERTLVSA